MEAIAYSVILPVFNECENLEPLIREIEQALQALSTSSYEIIPVDDKSTDGSREKLRELAKNNLRIKPLFHHRNAGQSAALASGMHIARGEVLITLDADGQNDPADIVTLINALSPEIDTVCGIRQGRKDTLVRRWSSIIANGFRNWITGDHVHDAGCTFRVMRRTALKELPVFNGLHRFIPTILRFQGYTVREIPIRHRPRIWGTSKYGIGNRMFRGFVDCFAIRWWRKRMIPARRVGDDYSRPSGTPITS
ncbi:MAG TPA: glycosyltransferase family 2 protein [Kiritimatiellia bacterium]|nr:glycosyltransferase family 2 protein [Kiritimatiellia bacterium]